MPQKEKGKFSRQIESDEDLEQTRNTETEHITFLSLLEC